jgi:paraquat-inducible protein B
MQTMTDSPDRDDIDALPEPAVAPHRRWTVSLIWLVPLVAAVIGLGMAVNAYLSAGPVITVSFESAEGLQAGKTEVKYKNVVIGNVHAIELSDDRSKVLVRIALDKKASSFARKGARYWVVRPRVGLGGISGLGTLLSGAYIGADTGTSDDEQTRFQGLETPPPLTHGEAGRSFVLKSQDLGSLDIGSPVYFRRIQVGRVVSYQLDPDGNGVTLQVFVASPNDRFVTRATRFWNASGIDVSVGASGLKLNTESLATVIAGGVAFRAPLDSHDTTPAPAQTHFRLFDDETTAMTPPDGPPLTITMRFRQSVRGLAVGSPVDFLGITLGEVKSITLDYDAKAKRFPVDVVAEIYPERLGRAHDRFVQRTGGKYADNPGALLGILIEHSLRAQLRNANLLTGQLYVALDFFPKTPRVDFDPAARPLTVPTIPGSFDKLQEQLASIVDKINKVPFDTIGQHLDASLGDLDTVLRQIHGELVPEAKATLAQTRATLRTAGDALGGDSPLGQNLAGTLQELQRAARSLRVLSDYLSRHPEALIRGRRNNDPAPAATPETQGSKP